MIDAVSMLAGSVERPRRDGAADNADRAELFARVLAKEVRSSLPADALGGEWSDVFGPLLDDMLATQIAADLREAMDRPASAPPEPMTPRRPRAAGTADGGRITSGYGVRMHPILGVHKKHHGIDIGAPTGTEIRAAKAGVVVRSEEAGSYGNLVVIDHGDGVSTRYAHCDRLLVKAGERVDAGAPLGTVGSTGRSTGPHLHFEVRVGDDSVDPEEPRWNDLRPQLGAR
jgi:murein DD-endopeptidase MepM/ murein hydrolase activator NlpD